jgi:predicted nucleic acid-binding protein
MDMVIDTSAVIAVLTSEPERRVLVEHTRGVNLIAPASVHWEIGNALAAMLKRRRIKRGQIGSVLKSYERIPIRYVDVSLEGALDLAAEYNLYAYDAYVVLCALSHRARLLSLDRALVRAASAAGVKVVDIAR